MSYILVWNILVKNNQSIVSGTRWNEKPKIITLDEELFDRWQKVNTFICVCFLWFSKSVNKNPELKEFLNKLLKHVYEKFEKDVYPVYGSNVDDTNTRLWRNQYKATLLTYNPLVLKCLLWLSMATLETLNDNT